MQAPDYEYLKVNIYSTSRFWRAARTRLFKLVTHETMCCARFSPPPPPIVASLILTAILQY
jgi:hypothetical protein